MILATAAPASTGELAEKAIHEVYHQLFDHMMHLGFDCVRDPRPCREEAKARKLPSLDLTPEQVEVIQRAFKNGNRPAE